MGVDLFGFFRAVTSFGGSGGGSTITQQLAKNLFLTSERSLSRKLTEILLALALEWHLSKWDILYLYLSKARSLPACALSCSLFNFLTIKQRLAARKRGSREALACELRERTQLLLRSMHCCCRARMRTSAEDAANLNLFIFSLCDSSNLPCADLLGPRRARRGGRGCALLQQAPLGAHAGRVCAAGRYHPGARAPFALPRPRTRQAVAGAHAFALPCPPCASLPPSPSSFFPRSSADSPLFPPSCRRARLT